MTYLYSEETLLKIKKDIKKYKFLYIFVACLFVIAVALLIIFASYNFKIYFMIGAIVVGIISPVLFVYFFDKRKFLIVIMSEFQTLLNSESKEKTITIIKSAKKPITLSDSTCVYEIRYVFRKQEHLLYLSNIFENKFLENKTYTVLVSEGYIIGYKDED